MKIGICDDQFSEREQIKTICSTLGYSDILLFSSGEALFESTYLPAINLLFLDIELDGISGIEIKNQLELSNPATFIVFITTHQELMPDAFGHNVLSFLTKPLSEHSVIRCIKKAAYLMKDFYKVVINTNTTLLCKNILYLHSEQKYTVFYTTNGETYVTKKSLKEWKTELENLGFCPVSRSTIINLKHFKMIEENRVFLSPNISLPVSRRYMQLLKEKSVSYNSSV